MATAAVKQVAAFAFNQLKLVRLEIVIMLDNLASRRVAEKVGATFEGVARNRLMAWGKAHDAVIYALIPEDISAIILKERTAD